MLTEGLLQPSIYCRDCWLSSILHAVALMLLGG